MKDTDVSLVEVFHTEGKGFPVRVEWRHLPKNPALLPSIIAAVLKKALDCYQLDGNIVPNKREQVEAAMMEAIEEAMLDLEFKEK